MKNQLPYWPLAIPYTLQILYNESSKSMGKKKTTTESADVVLKQQDVTDSAIAKAALRARRSRAASKRGSCT